MPIFNRHRTATALVQDQQAIADEMRSWESDLSSLAALTFLSGGINYSGEPVSEITALNLSAVWRAVNLIAGTLASIPLTTYRNLDNGDITEEKSFVDDPAGPNSFTPFEWKETVMLHLALHGEAFLIHLYNQGGGIVGLYPVHPYSVSVECQANAPEGKIFKVTMQDGTQQIFTTEEMTHICGPRTDGLRGMSPLQYGRTSLGMGMAAERAAANQYKNGMNLAGVLTPAQGEDLSIADIEAIREDLRANLTGIQNAGTVPLVNKILQFQPWQMTMQDAQFLESRQFQIEEISRWFGIPPYLLMQLDKSSSWGTGIAEQNKNLVQYVLNPLAERLCQRLTRLLPNPRYVKFDFSELESGSTSDLADLHLKLVNGGIETPNEGRKALKLPPVDGGDELRVPSGVMLTAQLQAATVVAEKKAEAPVEADPVTTTPVEDVNV